MKMRLEKPRDVDILRRELKRAVDRRARVITICGGTSCTAFGGIAVREAFEKEVRARGLADVVKVQKTGCHGFCERGPVIVILPKEILYSQVTVDDVPEIVEQTIINDKIVKRLLYVDPATGKKIARNSKVPFYAKQQRVVFCRNGKIDPTSINDYIQHDGYRALAKCLNEMTPEQAIDEVTRAGLRGRGGAGFPTGRKWALARQAPGNEKYVICNADEGDPGSFMDRSLLEGDPHAIIEGMAIAAYAIGAQHGYIYVRAEYPLAVQNARKAVRDAMDAGLLGDSILGTDFCFDIDIKTGAGAFVCGQETALIASIEGRRGMPRPRPPFPTTSGLWGKPTNVNNVETLANVPHIVLKGADWYAGIGTENSKGTKIFALGGKVNNAGLVELPMGTTLRKLVFEIGGGIPRGRKFKAAHMGGPSGGCVPARYLDLPLDYDSVGQIGGMIGSGDVIVMDDATCMVDTARFFMDFLQAESCGKCVPCRIGTRRMLDILTRITRGEGVEGDIEKLERLAKVVKATSLCDLGQAAANPVLSTIRYFRNEYEAHIKEKRCPAASCEALGKAPCQSRCPASINVPEYVALIGEGRFDDSLDMIRRRNPFASVCGRVCNHPCEIMCRRGDLDAPVAIRDLKRFAADRKKKPAMPDVPSAREGRVAVVGAGPAGLTAAYFLSLMGRDVTVYESLPVAGGMLAACIPEYRLPREALNQDIEFIKNAGVTILTGTRVDSLTALKKEGYHAVFVAVGAHQGAKLRVEGEDLDGVVDAVEYLRNRALGSAVECSGAVAIIGGGNAAMDSARCALRLGAESVTVLYRRSREEMPALEEEIKDAEREGVQFRYLVAPAALSSDNGRVSSVRCMKMELGDADDTGRRRPIPVEGSEFDVPTNLVVVAIGQRPDVTLADNGDSIVSRGLLRADRVTMATPLEGVFAGGDCVTGPATVIDAVAAGQKAACSIDKFLGGQGQLPIDYGLAKRFRPEFSEEEMAEQRRPKMRVLPVEKRAGCFDEVMFGYGKSAACAEALRCLRCDLEE